MQWLKFRYIIFLAVLIICSVLLAVSQGNTANWEYSADVLLSIARLRLALAILISIEVALLIVDRRGFCQMHVVGNVLYVVSILFALMLVLFCERGELLGLPFLNPKLSRIIGNALLWGIPSSVVTTAFLTWMRVSRGRL